MKKILTFIFLSFLFSQSANSFGKKEFYFEIKYPCSMEGLVLIEPLIGEPILKIYSNTNFIEPWWSDEAIHWHSNDNFLIFATLVDYTDKKPKDLFIFKLKRKKPINIEVIYISFIFEKDYFDFIGYKYNQPPYILDSKQVKKLITGNEMNKTWDNKLAKLLVNEIFDNETIAFYPPEYGLKSQLVKTSCDSELNLIEKPKKVF